MNVRSQVLCATAILWGWACSSSETVYPVECTPAACAFAESGASDSGASGCASIPETLVDFSGFPVTDRCSPDRLFCTSDMSFTPMTMHAEPNGGGSSTLVFGGPLADAGPAELLVDFVTASFSIDSLVGVPLRLQTWRNTIGCSSPAVGTIPGEPFVSVTKVLRDGTDGIIGARGINVAHADGVVVYGSDGVELLREIKIGWVIIAEEDCRHQNAALEVTTVSTGAKVVAKWNSRAHVEIGGRGYLFVTAAIEPLNGPCGVSANWVLIRDGFLHPVRDG